MNIYEKLVKSISLGEYEDAIQMVEDDPLLLWGRHTTWNEEKASLILKVFSPGVKESLSNVSPTLRMAAASSYLQTFPCISSMGGGNVHESKQNLKKVGNDECVADKGAVHARQKHSLINLLEAHETKISKSESKKQLAHKIFPLHDEFGTLLASILRVSDRLTTTDTNLRKTSKHKLIVFEPPIDDLPILDMCKRQWFNLGKVPLSRGQFNSHWVRLTTKFPFIDSTAGIEGLRKTCSNLRCSVVELKSFVEGLSLRSREVVLQDTEAKGSDISHVLSRIYWPGKQIRLDKIDPEMNAKFLRSQLFSLSTYWSTHESKIQVIKTLLMENELLMLETKHVPNSVKRIKIMRDFLDGHDRLTLLTRIETFKMGVMGFFSRRQGGYGKSREGLGIWRGKICGSSTEIRAYGNECSTIRVKHVSDTRSYGLTLANLLKEFNYHNGSKKQSDLFLYPSGRFSATDKNESNFRLMIDPELPEVLYADMETMFWDIDLAPNNNLKLVIHDSREGRVEKLTVLSDKLTSSDWIPEAPVKTPDLTLESWSVGKPVPTYQLETSVLSRFPKSRGEFMTGNWKIEDQDSLKLSEFKVQLLNYIRPKIKKHVDKRDEEMTFGDKEFDNFKSLIGGISMGSSSLDLGKTIEKFSWAEDEESNDKNVITINDFEIGAIDDLIKMFQHVEGETESFMDEIDRRIVMPTIQNFFSPLDALCQIHFGCNMKEFISANSDKVNLRVKGILGKIFSLVMDRWVVFLDIPGEDTATQWEVASTNLSQSILGDQDLVNLPLDTIESNIHQLESTITTCKGVVKQSMLNSLDRYLRLKEMKRDATSNVINGDKTTMMKDIIVKLIEMNLVDGSNFPKKTTFWPMIFNSQLEEDLTLRKGINDISNLEYQRYMMSIRDMNLDTRYVELIESIFKVRIEFENESIIITSSALTE
jgi:hypothetical protein